MNWIKDIRTKIGLTHNNMADYLLLSRSAYSYIESEKRSLTLDNINKLMILQELIKEYNESTHAAPVQLEMDAKQLRRMQNRLQACEIQAERLQYKLGRMENGYREKLKSLDMLAFFPAYVKDNPDKKRIDLWLSICDDETKNSIKKFDFSQQNILRLRIATLKAEATEIKKILAEQDCGQV